MYKKVKRALDIIISLVSVIILSPVFLITAVAVKLDSPGEVIFRQKRLGLNGKAFTMYKFRSMCVGAESKGTGQYSFEGDPRVTKVGKIIRATSIDELPQLINILKGDMSIIGPRPTLTYHPCKYEEYTDEQKHRFDVRPGVTGWAQIHGRKQVDWAQRIKDDVWYVRHLSLLLDIRIFFKTIITVITMKDNVNTGATVAKKENGE
ncbi:MAG: sugar transferase [Lachnospiraceae bacterium]|nr:sugar transferase [Lachnospiraceae bacterium]